MMATVPHVTSDSGLRKFQADGFLFDRMYVKKFDLELPQFQFEVYYCSVTANIYIYIFFYEQPL